ncbi:MAG: translation initiation factor [Bacteroidales bacterium]|nr:translation initiation factor [Bacteroidales bacterium]
MKKQNKRKGRVDVVYSTNPDYEYGYDAEEEQETLSPSQQKLYVSLDRKNRKGKVVTLVEGFIGSEDDMKELGKKLKSLCGSGGTAKERIILLQGDFLLKVIPALQKEGYQVKKKGG